MRGRVRMVCGILFRLSSYYYVQFSNGKACTFIVKRGRDWLDDDTHISSSALFGFRDVCSYTLCKLNLCSSKGTVK